MFFCCLGFFVILHLSLLPLCLILVVLSFVVIWCRFQLCFSGFVCFVSFMSLGVVVTLRLFCVFFLSLCLHIQYTAGTVCKK